MWPAWFDSDCIYWPEPGSRMYRPGEALKEAWEAHDASGTDYE